MAAEDSKSNEITRSSVATGGAHARMVGGGQAQPVSETKAAHAAEIECVAM